MHLAFVSIRNYRGITSLELTLGPMTTLIGENAYGKSNLLDALLVCLGAGSENASFPFLAEDFRAAEAGAANEYEPIEIRLGLRESAQGEWTREPFEGLDAHVWLGPSGDRRVELRVKATRRATADGAAPEIETQCGFVDGNGKPVAQTDSCDELVGRVRKHLPFVLLKADRYFTRPSRVTHDHRDVRLEERLSEEITALLHRVADRHQPVASADLEAGLDAAVTYVRRFAGDRVRKHLEPFLSAAGTARGGGSAARAIALLLVLGPILEARAGETFGPNCHPILAIEDAEADFHPTLLASVTAVIRAMPTQRILTTNSGEMLSYLPLPSVRRLVRGAKRIETYRLGRRTLSDDELRRIAYHVRANRGSSLFARAWLLVEGESEFWLLPELALQLGVDFAIEGIRCMEFAQCGVAPLVKLAQDLGIEWHLLADGDRAGDAYVDAAAAFLHGGARAERVTRLPERDVEHTMWRAGYADTYREAIRSAAPRRFDRRAKVDNPTPTIERAVRARSKPGMAIAVADAVRADGSPGVPTSLRAAIEAVTKLARGSAESG